MNEINVHTMTRTELIGTLLEKLHTIEILKNQIK
jgi:hypothetical protein